MYDIFKTSILPYFSQIIEIKRYFSDIRLAGLTLAQLYFVEYHTAPHY